MGETKSGRGVLVAVIVVVAAVGAYLVIAMPGMDHGGSGSMATMDESEMAAMDASDMPAMSGMAGRADPMAFERLMADPGAYVVNVHVPLAREIPGTDAFVPYDQIATSAALPDDRATPVLVYCETGRMSSQAAGALVEMGYSAVTELTGGMEAWSASGRALVGSS